MSQIKLKHSGGNSVIIAAPDSNPASDRTLKLPGDGDGTILTTNSSVGKLVNYSHTLKTDTFSASVGEGVVTGDAISVSHTAISTNNKLLISYSVSVGSNASLYAYSYLYIGGSVSNARGDANGSMARATTAADAGPTHSHNQSFQYIVQAASTNATTYSVRFSHTNNGTNTIYLNRSNNTTDAAYVGRTASTIQVLEFEPNT